MKLTTVLFSTLIAILMLSTLIPAVYATCPYEVLRRKIEKVEYKLNYGEQTRTLAKKELKQYRAELSEYIEEVNVCPDGKKSRPWYVSLMLKDIDRLSLKIGRKIQARLKSDEKIHLSTKDKGSS